MDISGEKIFPLPANTTRCKRVVVSRESNIPKPFLPFWTILGPGGANSHFGNLPWKAFIKGLLINLGLRFSTFKLRWPFGRILTTPFWQGLGYNILVFFKNPFFKGKLSFLIYSVGNLIPLQLSGGNFHTNFCVPPNVPLGKINSSYFS